MCGFLGVGGKSLIESRSEIISKQFDWLSYRGPDFRSEIRLKNFYLGFHRLAIVGLNNVYANQPIEIIKGRKNKVKDTLIEKINGEDARFHDLLLQNYEDYKISKGYTLNEIKF